MQRVELLFDGLDDAAVVVADRRGVNAGDRVVIPLASGVPVEDAVGPFHDEGVLRPFGHLVADEDLPQEFFFGRL